MSTPSVERLFAAQEEDHMATVELDGTELCYREVGDGEPGRAEQTISGDRLQPLIPLIERADPGRRDYPMAQHVDDLDAVIEELGIAPVHLVGHSYGAFLALLLRETPSELRAGSNRRARRWRVTAVSQ